MKNMKEKMNNKGFTLMELIIVVAILAILIALIAPNLVGFLDTASTTSREANAKSLYTAGSAWATQSRVAKVKVYGSATLSSEGTDVSGIKPADTADTVALKECINAGSLSTGATAEIKFGAGKCLGVKYTADGETAYYPNSLDDTAWGNLVITK